MTLLGGEKPFQNVPSSRKQDDKPIWLFHFRASCFFHEGGGFNEQKIVLPGISRDCEQPGGQKAGGMLEYFQKLGLQSEPLLLTRCSVTPYRDAWRDL